MVNFVHMTNKCPTCSILQLENQTQQLLLWMSFWFHGKTTTHIILCSTICLDSSMFEQTRGWKSDSSSDSTSLDESSVVPLYFLRSLVNLPILLLTAHNILKSSQGTIHPMVMEGHLPMATWPVSGDLSHRRIFRWSYWNPQEVVMNFNRDGIF